MWSVKVILIAALELKRLKSSANEYFDGSFLHGVIYLYSIHQLSTQKVLKHISVRAGARR